MFEQSTIHFYRETNKAIQSQQNYQLIYVLEGNANVMIEDVWYICSKGDLIVLNPGERYGWTASDDIIIASTVIDYYYVASLYKTSNVYINCNSAKYEGNDYGRIRYMFNYLLSLVGIDEKAVIFHGTYHLLWHTVIENCIEILENKDKDEQIIEMMEFIHNNYGAHLNLAEMAERWYMSESSFSRYFKKHSGYSFSDYLLNYRLERVCEELLHTNKSITDIAYDCGFANSSVLSKSFKRVYNISPAAFRNDRSSSADIGDILDKNIQQYLQNTFYNGQNNVMDIEVDIHKRHLFENNVTVCMNAGYATDLLTGKVQNYIRDLQKEFGFKYLRIKGIFDEELKLWMDKSSNEPNFEPVDNVLDFVLDVGAVPVIELLEIKKNLMIRIGSAIMQSQHTEFSLDEWLYLLDCFLRHIINRYTTNIFEKWRFELKANPEGDIFGKIPFDSFYIESYRLIKKYLPDIKIGACGLNCDIETISLEHYLLKFDNEGVKPDYITVVAYPYSVEYKDGIYKLLDIQSDRNFISRKIEDIKSLLYKLDYGHIPVWISEWNTNLSDRNAYNDTCGKACHILTQYIAATEKVEAISYDKISDYNSSRISSKSILQGASGLLSKDGLKKPAYYAMDFYGILGKYNVVKGDNYIINSREDGSMIIVACNPQRFSSLYHIKNEDDWTITDVEYLFENNGPLQINLNFKNLKDGRWKLRRYRLRESEGTLLAEWKKLNFEDSFYQSEIEYLRRICGPKLEIGYVDIENSQGNFSFELEENELTCIFIIK